LGKEISLHASPSNLNRLEIPAPVDPSWKTLYKLGGVTALISLLAAPAEIVIGLFPGVQQILVHTVTVSDWFALFQNHWFLGLRSLGLLNIVGAALFIPTILAIAHLLRREGAAFAALASIVFFLGTAVYLASSRAFPMLSLAHQYAASSRDADRALLAAAGQALLAEGESRSGILLIEFSFFFISAVMFRSEVFGKITACAGMLAGVLMMVLEVAFMPPQGAGMIVAAGGGLAMMTWSFLVGRRLLQMGR
jgi:hypothetical protein